MKRSNRQIDLSKVSKGVLELNPGLTQSVNAALRMTASSILDASGGSDIPQDAQKRRRRRVMNATEAEFARYLQSLKDRGEIYSFSFEGMTLRWGEETPLTYTADFVALQGIDGILPAVWHLVFYEIKGGFAWREGILRFKAAKAAFPHFEFCLYEKGKDGWQKTI